MLTWIIEKRGRNMYINSSKIIKLITRDRILIAILFLLLGLSVGSFTRGLFIIGNNNNVGGFSNHPPIAGKKWRDKDYTHIAHKLPQYVHMVSVTEYSQYVNDIHNKLIINIDPVHVLAVGDYVYFSLNDNSFIRVSKNTKAMFFNSINKG